MKLRISLEEKGYDITVERGAINKIGSYLNLNRKVLVLTDSGVPSEYSKAVLQGCKHGYIYTIPRGEHSKNIDTYRDILSFMVEKSFTRTDCVVCVGGGVVGDLGGFVASTYMRGIDFYNVPTTLLSQVDSSIGGKVAIDFGGIKNIVGAFYQPKGVVIDPDTLKTLDKRQLMAGLCEAIKMAITCDKELFELIEKSESLESDIDEIIVRALKIKAHVVEKDPCEKGLRRVLNFGHTIGHAVEGMALGTLLHGECVAIGMLPMCAENIYQRVRAVLKKYSLPTEISFEAEDLVSFISRDKKADGNKVTVIYTKEIGTFEERKIEINQIKEYIRGNL